MTAPLFSAALVATKAAVFVAAVVIVIFVVVVQSDAAVLLQLYLVDLMDRYNNLSKSFEYGGQIVHSKAKAKAVEREGLKFLVVAGFLFFFSFVLYRFSI